MKTLKNPLFMMEGILPPGHLDLRAEDLSGEWRRWVRSFSDYLVAIDLTGTTKANEKRKLALFRHAGGGRMSGNYTHRWNFCQILILRLRKV